MRKFKLFKIGTAAAGAAWVSSTATAALPPQYQRLAELQAVLETGVVDALDGALVSRVEYIRSDIYRVTAGSCHVDVAIVGLPAPRGVAGPRRFEARARKKVCR